EGMVGELGRGGRARDSCLVSRLGEAVARSPRALIEALPLASADKEAVRMYDAAGGPSGRARGLPATWQSSIEDHPVSVGSRNTRLIVLRGNSGSGKSTTAQAVRPPGLVTLLLPRRLPAGDLAPARDPSGGGRCPP